MEGNIVSSNEKHQKHNSPSLSTAHRYSQHLPAQTTKTTQPEEGATRSQRSARQHRPQTPSNAHTSFLENAAAKVGKTAQTVTHTSPAKLKSVLIGNKKRALDAERATTPIPQSYNSEDLIIGRQSSPKQYTQWEEDIIAYGAEEEEAEDDFESMQTDNFSNLADCLSNKDEKLNNLYNTLLEDGNFCSGPSKRGEIDHARTDQNITGCMTGLANTLLNQPYWVIMEQQTGLLQAVNEINKNMSLLMKKIEDNGEKVEHLCEESACNAMATSEQLKALVSMAEDTQSHISTLEGKTTYTTVTGVLCEIMVGVSS